MCNKIVTVFFLFLLHHPLLLSSFLLVLPGHVLVVVFVFLFVILALFLILASFVHVPVLVLILEYLWLRTIFTKPKIRYKNQVGENLLPYIKLTKSRRDFTRSL